MYLVQFRVSCRDGVSPRPHRHYAGVRFVGFTKPAIPKCHSVEESIYKSQEGKTFNLCKEWWFRENTLL